MIIDKNMKGHFKDSLVHDELEQALMKHCLMLLVLPTKNEVSVERSKSLVALYKSSDLNLDYLQLMFDSKPGNGQSAQLETICQ